MNRIVIAGLGLIGGSIAKTVRARRPELPIAGWDDEAVIEHAIRRGVIDTVCPPDDLEAGDLFVLAAPPYASLHLLDHLPARRGFLVTDVVSAKRVMVESAAAQGVRFVGGHPMAGSDRSGLDSATSELFEGKRWFLVDAGAGDADNDAMEAFVASLGARPEWIDAVEHDRLMAALSHLPQVTSSALMSVAARLAGESNLDVAGTGLRDTTRLAGSEPELWAEIAAMNAAELVRAVRLLREELQKVERHLEGADPLGDFFADARRWRAKLG